jgi:hypothetical protein
MGWRRLVIQDDESGPSISSYSLKFIAWRVSQEIGVRGQLVQQFGMKCVGELINPTPQASLPAISSHCLDVDVVLQVY